MRSYSFKSAFRHLALALAWSVCIGANQAHAFGKPKPQPPTPVPTVTTTPTPLPIEKKPVKKVSARILYSEPQYHSAFPSLIRVGSTLHLFARRATDFTHLGLGSQLITMRSQDDGRTWTQPQVIFSDPNYATQEGSPLLLPNGKILIAAYQWDQPDNIDSLSGRAIGILGSYVLNGGILMEYDPALLKITRTWAAPTDHASGAINSSEKPLTFYNRGAFAWSEKNEILWAVAHAESVIPRIHTVQLIRSSTLGKTWSKPVEITTPSDGVCSETSLLKTKSGLLYAFVRCDPEHDLYVSVSKDDGRTFSRLKSSGVNGKPTQAIQLADGRILLVYGKRIEPYSVMAKIVREDLSDIETAPAHKLATNLDSPDVGYPWALQLPNGNVLVSYYAHHNGQVGLELAQIEF